MPHTAGKYGLEIFNRQQEACLIV